MYAIAAYIILRLEPTSAQIRPGGLAATNTHAAEPDSAWSDSSQSMSLATTSTNLFEANDKEAKDLLSAKEGKDCPASKGPCADVCLEALADNSPDCPILPDIQECYNTLTAIGDLCGGGGECGTTKSGKSGAGGNQFNNCVGSVNDIYRRIGCKSGKIGKSGKASGESGKSGKESGDPGGNPGATCANVCLQALPNCPSDYYDLQNCYSEVTDIGEYCWGDGECGTSNELNNCGYGIDVYLRVQCDCLIVN